jgi:sulfonate transport system permease protein
MRRRSLSPRAESVLLRLAGVVLMLGAWELIAEFLVTSVGTSKDPNFPSIEYLATHSLLRMSDYWGGGWGVPSPENGGAETYAGAFLAIGNASLVSLERVVLGVLIGVAAGLALGLVTSSSRVVRQIVAPSIHFLRMVPFLAMTALFAVWFGNRSSAVVIFIAYAVCLVVFIGTINAVSNISGIYFARAAVSGLNRLQTYYWITLRAIVPEIRASILVSLGLAWTLDVAAELLGVQQGLGARMADALRFQYTGRIILLAIIYLVFAAIFFYSVQAILDWVIRWHPGSRHAALARKGAGREVG